MSAKKIIQARNMAELESLFWLSVGDATGAAKAACTRYAEDLSSPDPAVRLTAASSLKILETWAFSELDKSGDDFFPEGINRWGVYDMIKGESGDTAELEKAAFSEVFTRATDYAPGLFKDGRLTGAVAENLTDVQAANQALKKTEEELDSIKAALRAIRKGDHTEERANAINQHYSALFSRPYHGERRLAREEIEELEDTALKKLKEHIRKHRAAAEALFSGVHSALREAHNIDGTATDEWLAQEIKVKDGAVAAMNKVAEKGYAATYIADKSTMHAVMGEFFQLTGGKLLGLTLDHTNDRASAFFSGSPSGLLNVGAYPDKATLYHEMAHFLEGDGVIAAASRHFRSKTAIGPETWKLSEITGNHCYDDQEIAVKNGWIDPYVGKIYQHTGHTEVLSVALQHLTSPEHLAALAANDHGMLEFALAVAVSPASSAIGIARELTRARRKLADEFFLKLDSLTKSTSWHSWESFGSPAFTLWQPVELAAKGWQLPWYFMAKADGSFNGDAETMDDAKRQLIFVALEYQQTGTDISGMPVGEQIAQRKVPLWFKAGDQLMLKTA